MQFDAISPTTHHGLGHQVATNKLGCSIIILTQHLLTAADSDSDVPTLGKRALLSTNMGSNTATPVPPPPSPPSLLPLLPPRRQMRKGCCLALLLCAADVWGGGRQTCLLAVPFDMEILARWTVRAAR